MKPGKAQELERLIDRELKRLPDLPAPRTLVHRVMLAVHERQRAPWYRRAWPTWPREAQLVSMALLSLVALALGVVLFETTAGFSFAGAGERLRDLGHELVPSWQTISALSRAAALVFKAAGQQILMAGAVLALGAWLFCVGLTTACYRLAFQRP